jgi:small subunit ribosomal protein S18
MRTTNSRNSRNTKRTTNTKKVQRVITEYIDYKDAKQLQKFVNDQGKIIPKRVTGLSAKQHRELVRAIKRARQIAIMPFVSEAVK